MSFNIRNIREISNEPLTKFAWQLAKKFSRFQTKDQTDKLEGALDIYSSGQDVYSALKFHNFTSTNYFDYSVPFYSMFEPDNDKLRLWFTGTNLGTKLIDKSLLGGRDAWIEGEPQLIDGAPFDPGINSGGTKSLALKFNRPTSNHENEEYLHVDQNTLTSLEILGISTGKSYFIRFRVSDLAQQGGQNRTLFTKIDDSTPSNGIMLQLSSSGRLIIYIKRGGVVYQNQTDTSTIAIDTVYDVWVTYTVSGNVTHIYVNNSDKSLTDPGGSPNWPSTLTNHDFQIFRRGAGSNGYVYGDLYDFRVYNEKIVSASEVGYIWTNKITIADIPYGQVPISNWFSSYDDTVFTGGYTLAGYTTTGFTAS